MSDQAAFTESAIPRLRTLHLVSNRWFSALTDYALTAAAALGEAGGHSHVVLRRDSRALAEAERRQLSVTTVASFSPLLLPRLIRLIRQHQPAAVFCYEGPETSLLLLVKPWLPTGCKVLRFYGRDLRLLRFPPKPWLSLTTQHLAAVVVPSQAVEAKVAPHFPNCYRIPLARRLTAGGGVATATGDAADAGGRPSPANAPSPGLRGGPQLLMLGRLDPVKGHREFVTMFKAMLERWPEGDAKPQLTIKGEPANVSAQSLGQWLRLYGVADHAHHDDSRASDLAALLSRYDVGVIYSQGSEVICRVGAEMLMAGLGIIVTDVGALSELNLRANATDVLVVPSLDTDEHEVTVSAMIAFARARTEEPAEAREQRRRFYQRAFSYELMARRLSRLISRDHPDEDTAYPVDP